MIVSSKFSDNVHILCQHHFFFFEWNVYPVTDTMEYLLGVIQPLRVSFADGTAKISAAPAATWCLSRNM
jgi:hypothetical protein